MAVLGALAAGGLALWRAWRLPLLATAQPEAWHAAERRSLQVQGALAAIAFGLALAALARGGGLVAGFTLMGGLLIGAALLLPAILAGLIALAMRAARGPVAQWVLADSRQQMSGLTLALMALLLALAVNIGVGTMVGSFRATFLGWLDQRLAAEVYLTGRDRAQAEAIAAWADARPEVSARLPIWNADATIAGWPAEIYGFQDHATYRDNWPMLALAPDGWDRVAAGEAAMVSEQLARRAGLATGDTLTVPTPQGPWEVTVAGIYSDYGNPEGQIMIGIDALVARWPEVERLRYALRVEPEAVAELVGELATRFDLPPERIIDQAALKELSTRIFERTFTVTLALNALTLAVAGIALLTALLTLANLRLRQLAPVWALGLTRRQLAVIEMGKTLGLAGLTAVVALPLGLAVAWILTAVINVEAFGWRLPILMFPGRWAMLFALAIVTAFLAALWPVLRLRRTAPLTLLQNFTNER
jgi:putative ABC transport system permease protein